ncbi:unnamed protein product [Caenorhabditis nigoni]
MRRAAHHFLYSTSPHYDGLSRQSLSFIVNMRDQPSQKAQITRVSPATFGRILVGFCALLGRITDKTATKADQAPTNFRPTSDLVTAGAGFGSHNCLFFKATLYWISAIIYYK